MSTVTATRLEIGNTLAGKYRLDAILGSGGMGFVYRAFHVLLERDVALKVLRPEFAVNEESTERFLAEARAANAVRHPHVVDVLDVAVDEGVPFIVQEFLSGETLASRLETQVRLSIVDTLDLLTPIAAALAHAHERGIVHRDIKPENIFLSEVSGGIVPKLLDFGIAQSLREEFSPDDIVAGTPAYMAPELVVDPEVRDARSDLWSLGVVLFECLTGRLPFDGKTPSAMFSAICHDEPKSLAQLRPDLPAEFSALVQRCLTRDKQQRFENSRALLAALEAVRVQLRGKGTARVRWHSTLAPGTLRSPQAVRERSQRDPDLIATSDDVVAVLDPKRTTNKTPVAIVASEHEQPRAMPPATSEPPARELSVATVSAQRARPPARATVALAFALAALALVPVLVSQRRRPEGATAAPIATQDRGATARAPMHAAPPPNNVVTVDHQAPAVPSTLSAVTATAPPSLQSALTADAGVAQLEERRPLRLRANTGVIHRRNRDGHDAATNTSVAPLIQLRDER